MLSLSSFSVIPGRIRSRPISSNRASALFCASRRKSARSCSCVVVVSVDTIGYEGDCVCREV